jgi:dipeptidyl aminopeptidase/acylaminoacyl peptidase
MLRFCLTLLAGAALLSLPATDAFSQSAQPASAARAPTDTAVFAETPVIEGPELSPNGKLFAGKLAIRGEQYFAIIPLDESKPRLVAIGDNDLNWWHWVNDDWLVVGMGRAVPVDDSDWYVTRAWSVNAAADKLIMLSPKDAAQDADDVLWTARDGSPRVLLSYQTSIYTNMAGFWPRIDEVDVSTGKRKLKLGGREGVFEWFADGAGTVRMGIGRSLDGRTANVFYRDRDRENFRTIDRKRKDGDELTVPALFLKEPGKALMFDDDDDGFGALWELDLATLTRGKQLFASKGYDIGGLIADETGFGYLGIRTAEERPDTHWFDPDMKALEAEVAGMVKGGRTRIVSLSSDRGLSIVKVGGPDAPGAYFLFNRAEKSMRALGYVSSTLKLKRMHPVRTIRYKARDGVEIAAVLTQPAGRKGKLPLIVMPHGGPHARDSEEWDWWAQFLADRGYAVIQPNYRGSSGYGTKFARLGEGQWGLAMQDDLNDAAKALAELGLADPARMCIVGGSYGGYAAVRAAQRDGKLYRCAVSFAGVANLNSMLSYNSRFLGGGARRDWLRKQAPDLKNVSPVNFPDDFSIPVLLVHGAKDRVVPVRQSRSLAKALKGAGKDVTYIEQPLGDHHFSRGADRLEFLKALEAFLAKHNPA